MPLLRPTRDDQCHVEEVSSLFVAGAMLLHEMLSKNDQVSFDAWANRFYEGTGQSEGIATRERLMWLWDALRTEPELKQKFGSLPPAAIPWKGTKKRFTVFGSGEWFAIGLKTEAINELTKYPQKPALEETVAVRTLEPLLMKPGKGGRLECCDCHAEVTIRVDSVYSIEHEATIMEINEDRITLGKSVVTVRVDSLNQAYTVSSRRLEPNRRSHGGRTYDHVVHVGAEKRTPLETIRQQVENDDWVVPPSAPTPSVQDQEDQHSA